MYIVEIIFVCPSYTLDCVLYTCFIVTININESSIIGWFCPSKIAGRYTLPENSIVDFSAITTNAFLLQRYF